MDNRLSIYDLYQQIGRDLSNKIASEPDSFMLGSTTDELIDYFFTNGHYQPIEIDRERTESIEIKKERRMIPAEQREWAFQSHGDLPFQFESVIVQIPIKSHPELEFVKRFEPSSYSSSFFGHSLKWTRWAISFEVDFIGYGVQKSDEAVKSEVQQSIEWVHTKLNNIKAELEQNNKDLANNIKQWIEIRKRKIESDNDRHSALLKKIDIPLRQKEDEVVKRIQIDPKPVIQRVRPTPQQPEEYEIDRQKVLDIITILDNQGRQFEKTPKTYEKNGEEDLRNILLVNLNTVFEGKATGETFLNNGKTDIHLNIDKGNILAFEGKFWGGAKICSETIDQLLSYLTWRTNYGVIIFFSRNKDFSNVLKEGKAAILAHTSYQQGFHQINNTHFISHHSLPTDDQKHVELHHLYYTLAIS